MTLRQLGISAVGAFVAPAVLISQPPPVNRAPDKDASQVMVTAFKSADRGPKNNIGAQAADEFRRKMEGAFPFKQVYVIPVEKINPNLEASQFPTTEALEPHDAKALAVIMRADEYIAGAAERTPTGVKVSGDLVLTRDIAARQPLGTFEAPKLGDALNLMVKELKEARKQIDGEKKCTNAARDRKFPEAIQFAQAAITAYPKATLARMCLMSVLAASKAPQEEVAKAARELATLDSRSNMPLGYLVDYYRDTKQSDSLVVTLTRMIQNDAKNATLVVAAITEIAASTNPGLARPIIEKAVAENPGDPELLKLRWTILYAVKDYKEMMAVGQELQRLDTAFADTTYFQRTAVAFATDSQWQQAASIAAQGVAKFPTNPTLTGIEIQALQRAGQTQQALDKVKKAKAGKVDVPNISSIEITLMQELKAEPDQIAAAIREIIVAGDTTAALRQLLVNQANAKFSAAQKLMKDDPTKSLTDLTSTLTLLQYADSVVPKAQKPQVAFITGATNLMMGNLKAGAAQTGKSCPLAKEAQTHINESMISLQGGAAFAKDAMAQFMGMAMQMSPTVDQMVKAYCK